MTKKILFVAMQMSIHTTRWINQLAQTNWEVHLFPVNYLPVHRELRNVTVHQPFIPLRPKFVLRQILKNPRLLWQGLAHFEAMVYNHHITVKAIYPLPVIARLFRLLNGLKRVRLGESDSSIPFIYGPSMLNRLIKKLKPDLIHSLEFQTCGYNVLAAKTQFGPNFPAWLASNWGSDIYYFQQFSEHKAQITRLLKAIDYYSCECERDVILAQKLGLEGKALKVNTNTGGFNINHINTMRHMIKPSLRKIIMIKGYQHFAGRALTALDAVEICQAQLQSFTIVIFSASPEVCARADDLKSLYGLNMVIMAHSAHQNMLKMFSRARVYLGVSISDAISTSLLEALALGAFPIQTNTSCCAEWIKDGISGFEIPPDNPHKIAQCLQQALSDDALVDNAAKLNWQTVITRLDEKMLQQQTVHLYQNILQNDALHI
ncbi:MAG TPA: hypothetical protein DCG13_02090 [Legionellales bacterium]|nr:hypothetical protein [Legionellales bacterium]HCA89409.1 hypothetical protein [Legionellales bacterium]|tara:strand:- start:2522 stop:3817 length:1296 start_codon:yes stop_codon:yes gene_type:complete